MKMQQRRFNLNGVPQIAKRRVRARMLRNNNAEARMTGRNAYNFRPTKALLYHGQTREIYIVARHGKEIIGVLGRLSDNEKLDATVDFKLNGFLFQFPVVAVSREREKALLQSIREIYIDSRLLGF